LSQNIFWLSRRVRVQIAVRPPGLRSENRVNADEYNLLLEELDWRELTLLPPDQRRVEEH